ncbi:hypothetical protein N0V87_003298 [Didymella glomerata]|uniref:NADH:flavin oxidoreductase/NADH oxidase N-terminal domain-containing protein n=1 Tax=Didymella glomerata TaxID=749621 RepID=A0A9W9C1J7_9PLEO|nr:hypothetical protein N0V87_003298 [Didymella glomerata]
MTNSKLFSPLKLGPLPLQHRIAMGPLTRLRADAHNIQQPLATAYYTQRASSPGTLIIAEATLISPAHAGMPHGPGIWTPSQIAAWRLITNAVHDRGCSIVCQLVAPGRAADAAALEKEGYQLLSSSAVAMPGAGFAEESGRKPAPREMSEAQIWECVGDFRKAARNAIEAGFDGVEIHGANGYLVDQFTQDTCNQRTDAWGGSIGNRCRFGIEVARACAEEIGVERVGFRVSPWSPFQGMRMQSVEPTFEYLVKRLKELDLGYLHIIESRVNNNVDCESTESIDFLLKIWGRQKPVLLAGGYTQENVWEAADQKYGEYQAVFVFGRHFLANPDLVYRIREGKALNKYRRDTFYVQGTTPEDGYTDYPFAEDADGVSQP